MSDRSWDESDRLQSIRDERADERTLVPPVGARVIERGDRLGIGVIRQIDNGIHSTPAELYVLVEWQEDGYPFVEWRALGELVQVDA